MKWKFGIKLCGSVAIVVGCALMGAGSVSADSVPVPPSNLLALVSPAGLANPAIPRLPNSYSNTLAAPSSYNSWNSYTDEWFQAS